MACQDVRLLRALPSSWEHAVPESAVDGLMKRADAVAVGLAKRGCKRDAEELRRRIALLERADELHRHASDIETLVGLYSALAAFAHEREPAVEESFAWTQAGRDGEFSPGHGRAFRETAALRNRAFRWVLQALVRGAVS
jgi:hypothetical protein